MGIPKRIICLGTSIFLLVPIVRAQEVENELQSRTELELVFKPIDDLKLSIIPQLRFNEDFSLNKYLFEAEAEYDILTYLEIGASYRLVAKPSETNGVEYLNRYAFSLTAKKEYGRFEPALRLRYTNYADDEISDMNFLRYKASLKYDIKDCKFTPVIAAEAFQQLNDNSLYKMRYTIGGDYKLFKKNYLGLSYKLDYYKNEYRNRHIITLGYKIKF